MVEVNDKDIVKVIEKPSGRVLYYGKFLDMAFDKKDWFRQNAVKEGDIYIAYKEV